MGKKKKDKQQHDADVQTPPGVAQEEAGAGAPAKMKRKEYEREMRLLHGELVALQEWVKASGAKICIVFEGRDTAGKGGTIKRITERVSPRVFRVVALPAPTEREKSQMYIQRYLPHFPAAGEVVIFDRSWYNRAGVEPVMGFCTPQETERFLDLVPGVEKAMADEGILLLKYWLEVSAGEQTRRLESRIHDPRKIWKLSEAHAAGTRGGRFGHHHDAGEIMDSQQPARRPGRPDATGWPLHGPKSLARIRKPRPPPPGTPLPRTGRCHSRSW